MLSCWCYPACVKIIDKAGKLLLSSSIDDEYYTPFKSASCIVSFCEDNKPNGIVGDVPFLRQGLVKLDAETGLLLKVKRSNNILPLGMDVDVKRGILYIVSSSRDSIVWGSTLDLDHQRVLLNTKTGLSVGSHNLCFNPANQQLLVANKDIIDRFQTVG